MYEIDFEKGGLMKVIDVIDLKRVYNSKTGIFSKKSITTEALKGISFSVERGEVFGLLGPNGAGKTTTIKILTTMLLPTSGKVTILGHEVSKDTKKIRHRINFIFGGERSLYWRLSAYENLRYFSDLYKIDIKTQKRIIPELLELVGLTERSHHKVETFSKGMKQRLQIARGLINNPEILFLDEPTIGLDPGSAIELRKIVKNLASKGTTILITTHYMQEAEEICDRISIISGGEILAIGKTDKLIKEKGEKSLEAFYLKVVGDRYES